MEQNIQQNTENKSPDIKKALLLIIFTIFFMVIGISYATIGYKTHLEDPNDPLGFDGLSLLGSWPSFFLAFIISFFSSIRFRKITKFLIINLVMMVVSVLMAVGATLILY